MRRPYARFHPPVHGTRSRRTSIAGGSRRSRKESTATCRWSTAFCSSSPNRIWPLVISEACFGQRFVGQGAVTFFWSVIPSRMEWRYGPAAHRVLPMDVGHVCQNLYLSAEAIGAGACAVAAYDQESLDALLHLDGEEEFVIYLAPVGKHAVSA